MNILSSKLIYTVLLCTVTTMAFVWMIKPALREFAYQAAGYSIKPVWFLGKSTDPRGRGWWNQVRFYNHRRTYRGEHRGINW